MAIEKSINYLLKRRFLVKRFSFVKEYYAEHSVTDSDALESVSFFQIRILNFSRRNGSGSDLLQRNILIYLLTSLGFYRNTTLDETKIRCQYQFKPSIGEITELLHFIR